jgi:hypothetical protein
MRASGRALVLRADARLFPLSRGVATPEERLKRRSRLACAALSNARLFAPLSRHALAHERMPAESFLFSLDFNPKPDGRFRKSCLEHFPIQSDRDNAQVLLLLTRFPRRTGIRFGGERSNARI